MLHDTIANYGTSVITLEENSEELKIFIIFDAEFIDFLGANEFILLLFMVLAHAPPF